ncbi:MAG: hypothetical protein JO307_00125 [Bryobacterales bacterium]|nr:hypothetical protein [Bryobacterales bacterium]MBV9401365.1 hypothetical protein [Bryobacterales bacterium]
MAKTLRKPDRFAVEIRLALVMLLFVAGQTMMAATAEASLEAAIYKEAVLGDVKGAMEDYRRLAGSPQTPRPVAARALLQLGDCLEKSGLRDQARQPYTRIAKYYSDQTDVVAQAQARLSGWEESFPAPRNLTFEQGVEGKAPPGWSVPALPKDASQWAELRRSGCRSRTGCAVVLGNSPVRVGNLYQSISAGAYRGKTIRLTAWLRMEAADAGDRAQMWLSVDRGKGKEALFENMNDRPVQTADWTQREITADIDHDATFIEFGVMTYGRGRAWVDSVSFEVVVSHQ